MIQYVNIDANKYLLYHSMYMTYKNRQNIFDDRNQGSGWLAGAGDMDWKAA